MLPETGVAMGATVCIARDVGGGQREAAAEHMGNTITLFVGVSLILTAVLLTLTGPITSLMSTPTEAVAGGGDFSAFSLVLGLVLPVLYIIGAVKNIQSTNPVG